MNQTTIYQGSDRTLRLMLRSKDSGEPFDLSGASEIKAIFKGSSALVEKTLTGGDVSVVSPSGAGIIDVDLAAADTNALYEGPRQTFELEITISGDVTVVVFSEALNVKGRLS